jgi:hypothetical protein
MLGALSTSARTQRTLTPAFCALSAAPLRAEGALSRAATSNLCAASQIALVPRPHPSSSARHALIFPPSTAATRWLDGRPVSQPGRLPPR